MRPELTTAVVLICASCVPAPAPRRGSAEHGGPRESKTARAKRPAPPYTISRADDVIGYDGPLLDEGLAALRPEQAGARILMIRSSGGDIETGMEFGDWVLTRKLAVVVKDYCLSSCANYVFAAGRSRAILPNSVVAWHGSAWQADVWDQIERHIRKEGLTGEAADEVRRQSRDTILDLRLRQDSFFARTTVNECVTRVGNVALGAKGLFTMSLTDMARFGIAPIVAGPERAEDFPDGMLERMSITFVTVGDDIDIETACAVK